MENTLPTWDQAGRRKLDDASASSETASENLSETIRILTFASGKQLKITFKHDKDMLSFCETANPESYSLEDLCFYFKRNSTHPDFESSRSTSFLVEYGEHSLKWIDQNCHLTRLRIGPFIAQIFQEKSYLNIGLDGGNNHLLKQHYQRRQEFVTACGNRVIRTSQDYLIPTEVAALYSNYFYNIFYGDFKECREKFVDIKEIDIDTLDQIIQLSVLKSMIDWKNQITKLLEHSDRFSFLQCFDSLQDSVKSTVSKDGEITQDQLRFLQECSAFVRKYDLLTEFVKKFCLLECLEKFEEE